MKHIIFLIITLALLAPLPAKTKVKRVGADKQIDVSGNWNDTDIRMVCESLIDECVESRVITNYKKKHGKLPVVKLGEIMNLSDEHIDTSIIANKFRNAIINSGELKFVSSDAEVDSLRTERMPQEDFASAETAASLTNETGADFMLLGTLKTVVDSEGKLIVKTYFVNVELHDIETSEILWSAENSEIKKVITRSKVKKRSELPVSFCPASRSRARLRQKPPTGLKIPQSLTPVQTFLPPLPTQRTRTRQS